MYIYSILKAFVLVMIITLPNPIFAQPGESTILSVDWNTTGTKIATGHDTHGELGLVEVIDSSTGQTLQTFQFPGFIAQVAWSRHNSELLAAVANYIDMPGTIHILNTATGQEVMTLTEGKQIPSIAWSPDGSHIAASIGFSADAFPVRYIAIWDTTTGQISSTIGVGPREDLDSLDWSPDGNRIVGSDRYTSITVWDASTGIVDMIPSEHSGDASSVAWSPDGSRIASSSMFYDANIRIWDAATGQILLIIPDSDAMNVIWSPDGTRLASTNLTNRVRIWDASSGQLVDTITGTDHIRAVDWNPDGSKVVFGGYSGTTEIVQLSTVNEVIELSDCAMD